MDSAEAKPKSRKRKKSKSYSTDELRRQPTAFRSMNMLFAD
jgi:hypothetical protein